MHLIQLIFFIEPTNAHTHTHTQHIQSHNFHKTSHKTTRLCGFLVQ